MNHTRKPDFNQLLKVLRREKPDRPVLFEFHIGGKHMEKLLGRSLPPKAPPIAHVEYGIQGFVAAGYDYALLNPWTIGAQGFKTMKREQESSVGMAHGGIITDRESFEKYEWNDLDKGRGGDIEKVGTLVPEGVKLIIHSPNGVLENLISLTGYEDLCYMLEDDPELVDEIVAEIGSRLFKYYEWLLAYDFVGAAFVNDDWGFRTQTFLDYETMRRLIIPWHKKIVGEIHRTGRPALLHSCGQLGELWEDVIEDLKFEAKHSYEDTILPVEEAFGKYGRRIAILGGVDVDFLCRSKPEEIRHRARKLIEQTDGCTGYGLGSGNSIPDYVPVENFEALRQAVLEY